MKSGQLEQPTSIKARIPACQEAFAAAKRTFDAAKDEHRRAQENFKRAKEVFDQASKAFKARLEVVRSHSKKRQDDKKSIAKKAGVPYQYQDKVWVSKDRDGSTNIYFGGVGKPDGPGHGHYVMDSSGKVTYKREPFDDHGGQNFTESQRDYEDLVRQESTSGEFGFLCRFRGYDAYAETKINREGRPKIDIFYGPNGPFGSGHHHAVAYRESPLNFISDDLR